MAGMAVEILLLYLLGHVVVYVGVSLFRFLKVVWWNPIQVSKAMEAQGIRGPPYKFFVGNSKESAEMVSQALSRPMGLSSHHILPRVHPQLHAWMKTYGSTFLKWHGASPQLVVNDLEMIKEILTNRDGSYIKPPPSLFGKRLVGDGLLTTEGKKWPRQRRLANHSFRAESLKDMVPDMVESVEGMLRKWKDYDGKEVNLYEEFSAMTFEVISRTAFSSSHLEGKNIFTRLWGLSTAIGRLEQTIQIPLLSKVWRSQDDIDTDLAEQEIRKCIIGLIGKREAQKKRGDPDGYGSDFLGSLVKASHETEEDARIRLEDIIDECKTFYAAGQDTTTSLLTWTALLLAINPDWQDKARKEVIEIFGESNPFPDDTRIASLKTMAMIINESLRLYPPALIITRMTARVVKLGNLVLPAGMVLFLSPLVLHSDPKLWGEDAHLFKPERFAKGVVGATSNAMAFMPFGAGPRNCVGKNFATIETKVALVMILQRYSFTLSPTYVHSPAHLLTNRPQHGLQVILHKI